MISQIYSVQKLTIGRTKYVFGDDVECQFFATGTHSAHFLLTNPQRALDGILEFAQFIKPGAVKHIEYTIIASVDGEVVKQQRYEHPFTTLVRMDVHGTMIATKGALFLPYQLNVLLDSKKFGRAQSIQFIA